MVLCIILMIKRSKADRVEEGMMVKIWIIIIIFILVLFQRLMHQWMNIVMMHQHCHHMMMNQQSHHNLAKLPKYRQQLQQHRMILIHMDTITVIDTDIDMDIDMDTDIDTDINTVIDMDIEIDTITVTDIDIDTITINLHSDLDTELHSKQQQNLHQQIYI